MTMKQLAKKYAEYIDSYEFDEEYTAIEHRRNYWIYLKDEYETHHGSTCIHDNLDMAEYYLENVRRKEE